MLSHSDTSSPGEILASRTQVWVLSPWHRHTAVSQNKYRDTWRDFCGANVDDVQCSIVTAPCEHSSQLADVAPGACEIFPFIRTWPLEIRRELHCAFQTSPKRSLLCAKYFSDHLTLSTVLNAIASTRCRLRSGWESPSYVTDGRRAVVDRKS